MNKRSHSLSITSHKAGPQLGKAQKSFNNLLKQIDTIRAQIHAWEEIVPAYQAKYTDELIPQIESCREKQIEIVHALDKLEGAKGLSKSERRFAADLIRDLAEALLAQDDYPELKPIYKKYHGMDYDEVEEATFFQLKAMFEESAGIDLGDDLDMRSPDEVLRRAQEKFEEKQAQEEAKPKRKKTAKQIAREEKLEAEEKQVQLSLREVYRKLASALHPDRETDPQERERKTALMQRANQAYEKNDLLQLLELQLELEHIDRNAIANIDEKRLAHYNRMLKEQVSELQIQLLHAEDEFRIRFDIDPFIRIRPATVIRDLAVEIVQIEQAVRDLKKDLAALQDIKSTKVWLKQVRTQSREEDFDDFLF